MYFGDTKNIFVYHPQKWDERQIYLPIKSECLSKIDAPKLNALINHLVLMSPVTIKTKKMCAPKFVTGCNPSTSTTSDVEN
jgi:hypothetical protein